MSEERESHLDEVLAQARKACSTEKRPTPHRDIATMALDIERSQAVARSTTESADLLTNFLGLPP